jgi:uncharacterized protein (UPF0261 family)
MNAHPSILIIGTCDTKADEILFLKSCIEKQDASALIMDVGALGKPHFQPDFSNAEVAAAAGSTLEAILQLGDENRVMTKIAEGAARLTRSLYDQGKIQAMIALGGTMGTDLALDAASALPLGVPKFVVSTVAFSHLLPPDRMAADLMMILWPGGLYGLNSICKSVLSQAAGAVTGVARAAVLPRQDRPLIGVTSLGKACLRYMVPLKPQLEARGYDVAVFHSTGMGGRAFEALAEERRFVAVLDLCLQEVSNHLGGSVVTAGKSRLESAGRAGIPQIVAPGAIDMVDFQAWTETPARFEHRTVHAHNRLVASVATSPEHRAALARIIGEKLALAKGPVQFILPIRGVEEWDRPGEPLHDPDGLGAFLKAIRASIKPPAELLEIDAHINDPHFADAVLGVFDAWVANGVIPSGKIGEDHV